MNNIEQLLGYKFNNKELINEALTHSSYANENSTSSYERLEFLGDSILGFVVAEYLYNHYKLQEGVLSVDRTKLVNEKVLCNIVKNNGISQFIRTGKSVKDLSNSIEADVFESLLGAIYLDGGIDYAKQFVYKFVLNEQVGVVLQQSIDYKTKLQEYIQSVSKEKIVYNLLETIDLPNNAKQFTFKLTISGNTFLGVGTSKAMAEQDCAKQAVKKLNII